MVENVNKQRFRYTATSSGQFLHQTQLLFLLPIVNEGPNEFLNVRSPLYLAGVPEQTGTKAWKQWHLRNTTSFIGMFERNFS